MIWNLIYIHIDEADSRLIYIQSKRFHRSFFRKCFPWHWPTLTFYTAIGIFLLKQTLIQGCYYEIAYHTFFIQYLQLFIVDRYSSSWYSGRVMKSIDEYALKQGAVSLRQNNNCSSYQSVKFSWFQPHATYLSPIITVHNLFQQMYLQQSLGSTYVPESANNQQEHWHNRVIWIFFRRFLKSSATREWDIENNNEWGELTEFWQTKANIPFLRFVEKNRRGCCFTQRVAFTQKTNNPPL